MLGDLPVASARPRTGPGSSGQRRGAPMRPQTGFVGTTSSIGRGLLKRSMQIADANARVTPDGSLFIGDKGMITTGTYGEQTRLLPVEKMKDYQVPAAAADPLARPLSRLDPRLQGRRPGLLELQRGRAVRRVDAARRDRAARRRQAGVRCREDAVHQQRRSQQVPEADLPQRLAAQLERRPGITGSPNPPKKSPARTFPEASVSTNCDPFHS